MSKLELGQGGLLYMILPIIPIIICGCIGSALYNRDPGPILFVFLIVVIVISLYVLVYNVYVFIWNYPDKYPRLSRFIGIETQFYKDKSENT
jgi:hypothetical protein